MKQTVRMATLAALACSVAGSAVAAPPAPPKPAPKPAPTSSVSKPASTTSSSSARKPSIINLTATSASARSAQVRLAAFIHAVQVSNWTRARSYLSSRVTPAERLQLGGGSWLKPTSRNDLATLVYMPTVEIRTVTFGGTTATMRVQPPFNAWNRNRGVAYGVWSVPMVKENGQWMLNIHPDRKSAR